MKTKYILVIESDDVDERMTKYIQESLTKAFMEGDILPVFKLPEGNKMYILEVPVPDTAPDQKPEIVVNIQKLQKELNEQD